VPLFVRHGALIPTGPAGETLGDSPFTDVTLLSFGGVDATIVVHDVDGHTTVHATRTGNTMRVESDGPLRIAGIELVNGGPPL
jgi:alpha-D-xyloside xylohydrolase